MKRLKEERCLHNESQNASEFYLDLYVSVNVCVVCVCMCECKAMMHFSTRGNYRNLNQAFGAIQHRTRDDPIQTRRRITDYTGQDQAQDSRRRDPDWPSNEHSISDTWQGSNAWKLEIDRREAIYCTAPVRSIALPARGFTSARTPLRIGSNQEVVTLSNGERYPITQSQQEADIQTRYYDQPYEPPPVRLTRTRDSGPAYLRNIPYCGSCRIHQAATFLARADCSHEICDICQRNGCKICRQWSTVR